jgi:hypothetical protein
MDTDILVLGGMLRVTSNKRVRVDLSKLTTNEIQHLLLGLKSELTQRERGIHNGRCWDVPAQSVEVFLGRNEKGPEGNKSNVVRLQRAGKGLARSPR